MRNEVAGRVKARVRPGWSPLFAIWALLGAASGCVLDLPPPLDDSPPGTTTPEPAPDPEMEPEPGTTMDAGNGGTPPVPTGPDASPTGGTAGVPNGGGGQGGNAGGMSTGGGGAGGAPNACTADQRECDGECIGIDEPCCLGGCDIFTNATGHCEADTCVMDDCIDNFVDCDGESDNGCEMDFTFEPVVGSNTLIVPPIDITQPNAWDDIPLRPLSTPCPDCSASDPRIPHPAPINEGAQLTSNVWAGFAIAWDATALHLRAQVFDNGLPTRPEGADPRNYDNIEFLFDREPDGDGGGRLAFIGFDGTLTDLDNASVSNVARVEPEVTAQCYVLTATFTEEFLGQNNPDFMLEAGSPLYQFNVAVNDYDLLDPDAPEGALTHTGHLFFRDPGPDYWFGVRTLPLLELSP